MIKYQIRIIIDSRSVAIHNYNLIIKLEYNDGYTVAANSLKLPRFTTRRRQWHGDTVLVDEEGAQAARHECL